MPHSVATKNLPPNDWLRHVRRELGFSNDSPVTPEFIDHIISVIPESSKEASRKIWESRLDHTIDEIQEEQMETYVERFKLFADSKYQRIIDDAYFGIMPTRSFNAYAGFSPRGDRVVILHAPLTTVIAFWCHWYSKCLEIGADVLEDHDLRQHALTYFLTLWGARPDPLMLAPKKIYPATEESWRYSEILANACMHFILGHEVGHIYLKHTGYGPNHGANHAMEFQADSVGFEVCFSAFYYSAKAGVEDGADAYMIAPFLSLAIMSIFSDRETATHPSASARAEKLVVLLEKRFSTVPTNLKLVVMEVAQMFSLFARYREDLTSIQQIDENLASAQWITKVLSNARV